MKCPSCASTLVENRAYNNELACSDCGAEFSYKFEKLNMYTPGTYEKLCESVTSHIVNAVNDPMVISSLKKITHGFINEGSSKIDEFIDVLVEEADILYNHYLSGRKEKEYFCAYVEGINKLLAWKQVNEAGLLGISSMPVVSVDTPVVPGTEPEEELPDHEQAENDSIEKAQTALADLNAAIGDMQAAQTDELGGAPVDCGFQGSDCGDAVNPDAVVSEPVVAPVADVGANVGLDNPPEDIPAFNSAEGEDENVDKRFEGDEYLTTENYSFRVNDSVFLDNNETDKWKIISIKAKERKMYVQLGEQTQMIDIENDEIDVRLAEDAVIYNERVTNSENRMKEIWAKMEERIDNCKSYVHSRAWEPVNEEVEDAEGGGQDEGEAKPEATPGDRHGEYTKKEEDAEGADAPIEDGEGGTQLDEPKEIGESVIGDHFHNSVGEKRPFPFTQDPLNTHNDHFDDKELGDLEVKNRLDKANAEGTVDIDDTVSPKKGGIGGASTGVGSGGDAMGDSINYLKVRDLIYVKENYSVQWEVTKVDGPSKVFLKSGKKTCMINPKVDTYAHVDGVSLAWERESGAINESRKIWEAMEKASLNEETTLSHSGYLLKESEDKTEDCEEDGTCEKEEEEEKPILEKAELYERIKASGIHREPKTKALQELVSKYGNTLDEMIAVFEDAVSSEKAGNEKIEDIYGYQKPNDMDTKFKLENAWNEMESKMQSGEVEEVEEGLTDNSDGKHAEKQIAIGKDGINAREKRGGFSINL